MTRCDTNTNVTVNFLVPYKNGNIHAFTTLDYGGYYMIESMGWLTTSSMVVRIYRPASNEYNNNLAIHWMVFGY